MFHKPEAMQRAILKVAAVDRSSFTPG